MGGDAEDAGKQSTGLLWRKARPSRRRERYGAADAYQGWRHSSRSNCVLWQNRILSNDNG